MRRHLLALSLPVVLVAGCSFDKWSGSSAKRAAPSRVAASADPDKDPVTSADTETSIVPLPDETIARVQSFTQKAKLEPARPAAPATQPVAVVTPGPHVPNIVQSQKDPAPVGDPRVAPVARVPDFIEPQKNPVPVVTPRVGPTAAREPDFIPTQKDPVPVVTPRVGPVAAREPDFIPTQKDPGSVTAPRVGPTAARTPDFIQPQKDPVPVVETRVTPAVTEIPSAVKWLEQRPVELSLGPKQDPTPPAPVWVEPIPTQAIAASQAAVAAPAAAPDALDARLGQTARDYPRDLSAQLDFQLLQLLKGQQVTQVESLAALPRDDREMLWALMDSLANLRSNLKTDVNMAAVQKARPLINLGERLRAGADLHVATIALCSRVDGFGVYQPMPVDHLPSGRETTAVLYCEVENFLSRQGDAGQWETNLSQEITLYNDRGQRVWAEKTKPVKDLCRNRRHDFFVGQRITLPSALLPGSYSLRVTIVDQNTNHVAESTLAARVVAER